MTQLLQVAACASAGVCAYGCANLIGTRAAKVRKVARRLSIDDLLHDKTLSFALFAALGVVVAWCIEPVMLPVALGLAFVLSRRAPAMLDKRRCAELRSACDAELDVMCDIVAMGTRSGLSFDAALGLYCERFDGVLAREVGAARLTWQSGIATRERALNDLARRLDSKALHRFNDTVLQAIGFGSPIAEMLVRLGSDLRNERRVIIERQVEKAPVKMLIPTGTCILPAMLILVMGPVILQFLGSGI